jgi:hypothetical protein
MCPVRRLVVSDGCVPEASKTESEARKGQYEAQSLGEVQRILIKRLVDGRLFSYDQAQFRGPVSPV